MMSLQERYVVKQLLLADETLNKASFRKRFMGHSLKSSLLLTLGADFSVKLVHLDEDILVEYQVWDINLDFSPRLLRHYIKNAKFAVGIIEDNNGDYIEQIRNIWKKIRMFIDEGLYVSVFVIKETLSYDEEEEQELYSFIEKCIEKENIDLSKFNIVYTTMEGENVEEEFKRISSYVRELIKEYQN